MRFFAHLALLSFLTLASALGANAAGKGFTHEGVAGDAKRYETFLKANWKADGKKASDLKADAEKVFATDARAASRSLASVVASDDKDGAAWTRLAQALLAIKADPDKGNERYDLPVHASGAAYRGYELAKDAAQKSNALFVLGQTLERRSYWRPAIDALKMSFEAADNQAAHEAYDKLRAEHGFRMMDYKVDNEATPPRLCLQFSEDLSRTQTDVAKFISIDGKDPSSLVQEGKQLCLEGLKHGERYQVQIRAGLPSEVGETLNKNADIAVYVPDRTALVRFAGKAYVLPTRGQQGIPVITTNTKKIEVEIFRIGDRNLAATLQSGDFQRQLSSYEIDSIRDKSGIKVFAGEVDIAGKLNEDVTTAVPVTDATNKLEPGAYVMVAKPTEKSKSDDGQRATQWFIVSDLGLTAFSGGDGVHAFVRSLANATSIGDVTVKLVARNNEVLATTKTDAKGYAKFDAALAKGEGGTAPAVLVAEKGTGEYAFLDLTLNAFDLSDRGVKGRDASGPIDAFVYTERGVYRAGEEVNVTALVRDRMGKASSLPMTMIVMRPDGVEQLRQVMNDQGLGGRATTLPMAKTAMTGTWRVWLHTDPKAPAIAERAFLVEDFVPERLDMKLEAATATIAPEQRATINADGRYLYGPPAAALGLEGEVIVKLANKDVAGFAGYHFGQSDDFVNPVRQALDANLITDAVGKAAIPVTLPAIPKTARPLEADVIVKLRESGGRTIERKITLPVDMKMPRIGIKPLFDGSVKEDADAAFEVVMLDAANKTAAADKLQWTLTRLDTNWQWYRRDSNWTYEAVTVKRKVGSGTLATLAEAPAKLSQKIEWGRYRLDIASAEVNGPASSFTFSSGWYTSGEAVDSPEQLDVALDKETYKAGDVAKLRIASKLGGKALISVLGTGLHMSKEVEIAKGGGEVPVEVGANWGPGVYVTAMLYRPMDEAQKRMPNRAIGVKWLALDQSARELKVALTLPEKVKSATKITVPVKVDGIAAGEDARVVVAAVDLGILNLTKYETPAPEAWFNAQQKLGFEIRDFYGRLIDGMRADRGKLKSGGDGSGGVSMQGNPTVETIVSLYSGIVKVGSDGTAKIDFDLPDFNGTVRVMAVAWSADKVGHTSSDLIVRDAVALTVAAPRFLTLGDEVQLGFDVHNIEGAAAAYKIALSEKQGDASNERLTAIADRSIDLKTGERKSERISFKPKDVGHVTLRAVVSGPGDIAIKREMTFDVLPPAGDIKRTTISSLKANGGKLTLNSDLIHDLIPSRTRINLSVGPAARFDVPSLLTKLDRYPYGCAEQTVSRAMPLVYANAVAAQVGLGEDKALKERIQGAVTRVFEMQDSSGAFGVWGPSNTDLWLTAYVTDFLTRAKETGTNVPKEGFNRALDKLQNFISYAGDFQKGGEDRAYALYVLARNGRAPIGELRYYADTRIDRFSTPLAKAQVGAALAMMGDKERAERAFATALASMSESTPDTGYRADYGSTLRDSAALVTLASETGIAKAETPKLANVIAKAYETRSYTSTQEQAWMLLAAKALNDEVKSTTLSVDGKPVSGPVLRGLSPAQLQNGGLTVTNDGDAAIDSVVSVIGAALTPEPAVSKGFKIERQAFTMDGKKVDLKSLTGGKSDVKQNDRFVIALKITSEEAGGRVMLVDRMPAGFEIENPRLVESGSIAGIDWLKSVATPEHTEFRDDRFVAAFNFSASTAPSEGQGEGDSPAVEGDAEAAAPAAPVLPDASGVKAPALQATVAYIVRAVTPGTYLHPAATVEDMYRPERYARTAAGTLTVGTKE
jgi:alpha-2-macroglobulin